MGEGHDACNDACEARHPGENHEGSGGIPVSWKKTVRFHQITSEASQKKMHDSFVFTGIFRSVKIPAIRF